MSMQTRIALSLAAAALWQTAPAMAVDYEPPILVESGPEYVPVEVGSGWYLRGDVGYNLDRPLYDFTLLGEETDNIRFNGGVGVGYHFTDFLRAELNLGFVARDTYDFDNGVDRISAKYTAWTGMVNGYVDLGTVAGFTPYVGAGAGFLSAKQQFTIDSPSLGLDVDFSDRQYEFAYSLGAGVNYRLSQNVSMDFGYQYLSSPGLAYLDTDTLSIDEGVDYHQLRVGLRYDLW
ncbi:outer membrane protein [Pseudaminobacter sp. NGMCC 1.201702]|uniref:outer membrane protein n=1 Tax=Pseudaminobacter sp. NGMCC 1.201702 TaxID=3391825 RepID=UPI0039EFCF90